MLLFNQIMENSMAMWMLVSGLFPILFFGILIKSYLYRKHIQNLIKNIPEMPAISPVWIESDDWVPTP